MQFLTKGQTLRQLESVLIQARVLPSMLVTARDWQRKAEALRAFLERHKTLIVRSSCSLEDSQTQSAAGKYTTRNNISDVVTLTNAINEVFASYGMDDIQDEEVLIQPQLTRVDKCGVMFTVNQSDGSDYYVINYDESGKTDAVTSGASNELTTIYLVKESNTKDSVLSRLVALAKELETLFGNNKLDIEFAIDDDGELWLLQVRPLVVTAGECVSAALADDARTRIKEQIRILSQPHPYLFGSESLFGVMPDWNPAEIIGIRPHPLALSLYQELVTDSIWAYQRNNYGYLNLRSFPLLVSFAGLPYIDVRVSFNSFIPKNTPRTLADRLVNHYITQLKHNPVNHDKVEFNVVLSCYTMDFESQVARLKKAGFTSDECATLGTLLRELTNNIIDPRTGLWIQDVHKIEKLKSRQRCLREEIVDLRQRIYWQLEDCKRYGTLPFAGLARAAFIAVQMLRSLVREGVLSRQDYETFMGSLNTVSSQMSEDLVNLDRNSFIEKYGHLRPGTYEITSPRYDKAPDLYFSFDDNATPAKSSNKFTLSRESRAHCAALLEHHGINHSVDSLFHFIKCAIEGREYAKFVFTRSLSDTLEDIALLAKSVGLSRENAAFLNIADIKGLITSTDSLRDVLTDSVRRGKARFKITKSICLPPLIVDDSDVDGFRVPNSEPNFITDKQVTAEVAIVGDSDDLTGKIVFIPSADPGYDWLFSKRIGGLVTQFGGVNSHMAIRANELSIPAVVGAGESLYAKWRCGKILEVNALIKQVRVLR